VTRLLSLLLLLAVLASPNFAKADAAGDLAAGQAALQELELEKALPLLKSAAEALPKSVEAQLTVAECQLRLGNLEQALTGYRAVVKLSPNHKLATRMVNALTGRESSFEKKMAMTRALITVEDYAAAAQSAAQAIRLPADAKQRRAAQLLQAECSLWNADLGGAVTQSLDILQQGDAQASGIAHVIAILALVENPINNREVEGFIKKVGEVPQIWKTRLEFAQGLLLVHDLDQAAAASALLLKSHTSIPASAFRHNNTQRAAARLILHVGTLRQRGEISEAWNVMRPLAISAAAQAAADKKPGSIPDVNTGWYVNPQSQVDNRWITAATFGQLAGTEFRQNGTKAALRGYRIGAAILDGYPEQNVRITDSMQRFANELNSLSRVDADRVGGQPLSPADAVQFEILGRLANRAVTEKNRASIVAQIDLQLKRYAAADDLETGLNQFLTFDKGQNPSLTEPYNSFPIELTRQELLNRVAQGFAVLGAATTSKVQAAVIKRAVQLNEHDTIALKLYAKSNTQNSKGNKAHAEAMRIVNRYSSQANWDAAGNALALLYKGNSGSAGQWADVSLTLQQARHFENQLVAARRSIGTELSAPVQAALAKAAGIVKASPNTASKKVDRHTVTQIAADWINRYAGMGRLDLSEAFIAGLADGDAGAKSLADWALWNRVNLLHMQANESLARTAAGTQDRATVAVDPKHIAELALLSKIIIDHSSSDYAPVAVRRVAELSGGYQAYRAYPAATSILTNFLTAHPNLSSVQQFEFGIVDLQLADANNDLNESVAKNPRVEKITAKHLTAINAIAAFLKKYPVGDYSRSAEDQLFAVLKRYGEVGAWNVSRDVLAEFTKALPDYRSPAHLKLLQAATFLGELNTKHGMAMLTPNPTLPKTSSTTALNEFLARDAGEAFADPGNSVKKPDDSKRQPLSVVSKFESVLPGQSVAGIFRQGNGQGQGQPPAGFGGGGGGFRSTVTTPSASSLAMIRQSKSLQFQQLAMLEGGAEADLDKKKTQGKWPLRCPLVRFCRSPK
jgi:tetratricopeptide (TPR) repeat protein